MASPNDNAPEQPHEQPNQEKPANKATLQGGYECTLVEKPPEHLQTECSVCLCLLRDPYLVDCCGYSFCESCIESVRAASKPCPLCNTPFTNVMPDKRLQRQLNGLHVHCSNKTAGCEWIGELGTLDQHLNVADQSDDKLAGCKFTLLPCSYCDEKHQRPNITRHEKEECRYRPYSCDYCNDYSSTCEDVTVNHWPVCGSRPVPCPNECGVYPEHQNLEEHVGKKCPLQVVYCDFDYVGCETKLLRKEMAEHVNSSLGTHMSLLAISHKKQQTTVNTLIQENGSLRQEVQKVSKENISLRKEVEVLSSVPPVQFTLVGFTQYARAKDVVWTSSPFYTHPRGYKMCLKVSTNTVTASSYRQIKHYIGLFVHLMKGEFDNKLKWPFLGIVHVDLTKQLQTGEVVSSNMHKRSQCVFNISEQVKAGKRVVDTETSKFGSGSHAFIAHDHLASYLVKDCLHFRIDKVNVKCFCY